MKKNKSEKRKKRSKSEIKEIIRENVEREKQRNAPFRTMSHSKRKRFARGCRKLRMLGKKIDYFFYKKYGHPQELEYFLGQGCVHSSEFVKDMSYHIKEDHETKQFFAQGFIQLRGFTSVSYIKELFKSWKIQLFDSIESCENNVSL